MLKTDYDWYAQRCEGVAVDVNDGVPECGYYRARRGKNGRWLPMWISRSEESGALVAFRGFGQNVRDADPEDYVTEVSLKQVWPWAAENVVPWDAFDQAYRTGEWPGSAPVFTGDNKPAEDHAGLKAAIEDQTSEALAWLKKCGDTLTKEQGDKAADWQAKIHELKLKADKLFREEKDPLNALTSACDEKWSFRKKAESACTALKKAWVAVAKRLDDEKQAAAKKALEAGAKPEDLKPIDKVKMGGTSSGSGKSLRTVKVCVVKDYDKAIEYLRHTPGFLALIDEHVKTLHKAGVEVPGTMIEQQKVA